MMLILLIVDPYEYFSDTDFTPDASVEKAVQCITSPIDNSKLWKGRSLCKAIFF